MKRMELADVRPSGSNEHKSTRKKPVPSDSLLNIWSHLFIDNLYAYANIFRVMRSKRMRCEAMQH